MINLIPFCQRPAIHLSLILHNHLCVVHGVPGDVLDFSAIPLSTIFNNGHGRDSGKAGTSASYMSVRSQDVFRDSTKVRILNSDGTSNRYISSSSVCTSSWKTPAMCEHDAPATPTRILLLVRCYHNEYKAFELMFSPASVSPMNSPSPISIAHDVPQNGYHLTCQRQSLSHSYRRKSMVIAHLTSATRTGYLFALHTTSYAVPHGSRAYATAVKMLDPFEEMLLDGSIESIRNNRSLGRAVRLSPIDDLIDGVIACNGIHVEPYSGTIWYCSGSNLFVHRTD